MFIHELAEPTLLVIYPGRFQPFHKGHHAVYEYLTGKFGRNNVYIATSNKTDNLKSPFTFAEKAYFMQLTGVPADRIVQAAQPYQIQSILQTSNIQVDEANTVVIFAVSAKDMAEDPRFSFASKKDGSTPYFQPLRNIKDTEAMNKHGYIMTVPTFDFTVLDKPMQSGTELRQLYADSDEAGRQKIIADLFGRYTREAEQIMNSRIPAQKPITGLQPAGAAEPVAEGVDKSDPKQKDMIIKARVAHPLANSDEEALALYINDKEEYDVGRLSKENNREEEDIDRVEQLANELRARMSRLEQQVNMQEDAAGVGVVAKNKKMARDPRYSTSMTVDVNPNTPGKNLRAFKLAEQDREPYQQAIDRLSQQQIGQLNDLIDEITHRITTERLPAQYVQALKQRMEKLKAERAQIALGR